MATQARYDPQISGKFTGTLLDSDGTAIPLANIDALTLTLTNAADGSTVNSRSAQNVLNTNNVTVDSTTGALTWLIQPEDTTLVDTDLASEDHVAVFNWTYETSKKGSHTHRLHVVNFLLLCTVEDVEMLVEKIPTNDVPLIEWLIEMFSTRAEALTHRKFKKSTVASPTVETFGPKHHDQYHYRVEKYPIDSITSILQAPDGDFATNPETLESTAYTFNADTGLIKMRWNSFMKGENTVQITYAGGLAREVGAVPQDIRWAAARQVSYWYQRRKTPGVSEIQISRGGRQSFVQPIELLPEVEAVLMDYRPIWL